MMHRLKSKRLGACVRLVALYTASRRLGACLHIWHESSVKDDNIVMIWESQCERQLLQEFHICCFKVLDVRILRCARDTTGTDPIVVRIKCGIFMIPTHT
ncbi:hypothetical protein PsorP6_002190 [Peronosclerospora sorghi]|uniref:Uncharacterized protein n=1 Tax=Peronosclerospora sorghi TaxID=230839 RepID=A0ACC0WW07_9STRA|nr:hypothetical protein PsorP6_002190 [Peronosclerospora sorghi]